MSEAGYQRNKDSADDGTTKLQTLGYRGLTKQSTHSGQPWYWPYTTREEAERWLAGQPDGSFLVRDCSVPGDFTLTVRQAGCNKCVRIYKQQKGFSLSKSESETPFASLEELVDHYRHNSLASFNRHLDVPLLAPVTKSSTAKSDQYSIFKELYDLTQDQLSVETRLSVLQQQRADLDNKLKRFEPMMRALNTVQHLYYDCLIQQSEMEPLCSLRSDPGGGNLQKSGSVPDKRDSLTGEQDFSDGLTKDEEKRLTVNTRLLMSRREALSNKIRHIQNSFEMDSLPLKELEVERQSLEVTLLDIKRRYEELVRQMMDMGCKKEFLSQVLEPQVTTCEFDRSTWLLNCKREEALAKLEKLPHGAFLIRPKSERRLPYVLSIVVSSDDGTTMVVQHCHIVRPHGRGYGFNATLAVFESIDQLVLRHRYVSLRHYFKDLDVTLAFPVGCQEMLRHSSAYDRKNSSAGDGVYANAAQIREVMIEMHGQVNWSTQHSISPEDKHYESIFFSRNLEQTNLANAQEDGHYEPVETPETNLRYPDSLKSDEFKNANPYEPVASSDRSLEQVCKQNVVKEFLEDTPQITADFSSATFSPQSHVTSANKSGQSNPHKSVASDRHKSAEENPYEPIMFSTAV